MTDKDDDVGLYAYGVPPFNRPGDQTSYDSGCLGAGVLVLAAMFLILLLTG